MTTVTGSVTEGLGSPGLASRVRTAVANPWGRPRFLWAVGLGYVAWSLVPIVIAVLFSFNRSRTISSYDGLSLRWYLWDPNDSVWHDPDLRHSVIQSLKLAAGTVLITVPLVVGFAVALDRWRGRTSSTVNFLMMFSLITPELLLSVALFLLFINLFTFIGLGTLAQLCGMVIISLAYVVVIVRARLVSIGREYEEAARDLGASPVQSVRRVLLPLLLPAIFASGAIVFAFILDDFVMASALSSDASTETIAIKIYTAARTLPTPAVNALGTLMLVISTIVIALALLLYRRFTRGERRRGVATEVAGI